MKQLLIFASLSFILLLGLNSCGNKNKETSPDTKPKTFNIDPKNEDEIKATPTTFSDLEGTNVSSKLEIKNATKIIGELPTSTENGPTLTENDATINLRSYCGGQIKLSTQSSNSSLKGIYLQIDGANEYFNIPASEIVKVDDSSLKKTNAKSLKTTQQLLEFLLLNLPQNLPEGVFCINYCVYDENNEISNILKRCIEVQTLGGDPIVQGTWEFETATYYINNKITEITKGEPYSYQLFSDDVLEKCRNVVDNTIDQREISFNSSGKYSDYTKGITTSFTFLYAEDGSSDCSTENSNLEGTDYGSWAYNNSTETLTVIPDPEDDVIMLPYTEFRVRISGDKMTLTYVQPFDGFFYSYIENYTKK